MENLLKWNFFSKEEWCQGDCKKNYPITQIDRVYAIHLCWWTFVHICKPKENIRSHQMFDKNKIRNRTKPKGEQKGTL